MIDTQLSMGSVTIRVKDLRLVTDFYTHVVGLDILSDSEEIIELGAPSGTLVKLIAAPEGQHYHQSPGLYHLALRVPARADLGAWLSHYTALDAPYWQGASDHGVSEALYLSDPEGNGIEIYWDRPSDRWPRRDDGSIDMYTRHLDLSAVLASAIEPFDSMPEGVDMGHVHLRVSDITRAKAFYVDTLEFDLKFEMANSALFIAAVDYHHHLGLNVWHSQGSEPVPIDALGLAEVEIKFTDREKYQRITAKLSNTSVTNGDVLVQDPSGIMLRLAAPA